MSTIHVVHVETGRHVYGGARQVLYLLEHLPALDTRCTLVCPLGAEIGQQARKLGAEVIELPMRGDLDVAFAFRFASLLRRLKPDLVHVHSRRGADVWGGLGAKWAGVPAILSRRVDNPEGKLAVRLKYPLYRRVITIAEGIRTVLLQCGVPAEQVQTVRSAIDPAPFQAPATQTELRSEFAIAPAAAGELIVLGIVAQLIPRKGHALLLDCLAHIAPQWPQVRLIIFGRGPQEEALRAQVAALGLAQQVVFAGFRNDLPRWLGALDLLVHPASMEGLGVSLLQAAAAGVPVLACRAGGIPEAVADERTGVLVPPNDAPALTAALLRLLQNPSLRQRLGAAGPAWIAQEFAAAQMAAGNRAVYQQVWSGTSS